MGSKSAFDLLGRDARELSLRIEGLTKSPAALLLPAPVREAIRDLAQLVSRIAAELRTMQSNTSAIVTAGKHKGRAGRVISPAPYAPEGAKKGDPLAVDIELDADDKHERELVTVHADQLGAL